MVLFSKLRFVMMLIMCLNLEFCQSLFKVAINLIVLSKKRSNRYFSEILVNLIFFFLKKLINAVESHIFARDFGQTLFFG